MTGRVPRVYTLPAGTVSPEEKRRLIRAYFAAPKMPKRPVPPPEPQLERWRLTRRITRLGRWGAAALTLLIILAGGSIPLALAALTPGIICFFVFRYVNTYIQGVEWKYQSDGVVYINDLYDYREKLKLWQLQEKDLDKLPSGTMIDRWLREDMNEILTKHGMKKLNLVPEQLALVAEKPQIIFGPLLENRPNELGVLDVPSFEFAAVKFDVDDQKYRFPCYQFMVIYLDEDRISAYAAKFNFLHFTFTASRTFEYLYRDIVSVSTEEISINYQVPRTFSVLNADGKVSLTLNVSSLAPPVAQQIGKVTLFRLAVPSGDSASVTVDMDFDDKLLDGNMRVQFESQMNFIRSRLLNKK